MPTQILNNQQLPVWSIQTSIKWQIFVRRGESHAIGCIQARLGIVREKKMGYLSMYKRFQFRSHWSVNFSFFWFNKIQQQISNEIVNLSVSKCSSESIANWTSQKRSDYITQSAFGIYAVYLSIPQTGKKFVWVSWSQSGVIESLQ